MFIRFDMIHERDGRTDTACPTYTALMHMHRAVKTAFLYVFMKKFS